MSDLNLTKGLVPLPPHQIRDILRPEGHGWSGQGKRTPMGFVLHRMQGTLWGTDGHFQTAMALTDYGIDHTSGAIIRWSDPYGVRSGWASGPVKGAYGDGAAFIKKYGVAAVNRDQVSWEISGFFAQPGEVSREDAWSDVSKERTAQAMAHYGHDYGIPHTSWPIAPQDRFSFVRWHQEFTIGTGKVCPGKVVMDATGDVIARAGAILKQAQQGNTPVVPIVPIVTDPVVYATPVPIPVDPVYSLLTRRVEIRSGGAWTRKWADPEAATTGPVLPAGSSKVAVAYVTGVPVNGERRWWILDDGSRLWVGATMQDPGV